MIRGEEGEKEAKKQQVAKYVVKTAPINGFSGIHSGNGRATRKGVAPSLLPLYLLVERTHMGVQCFFLPKNKY